MFCHNCGKELPDGSVFCSYCGTKISAGSFNAKSGFKKSAEGIGKSATSAMNAFTKNITGEETGTPVEIRFRDVFSGVFKKHTQKEADELFICGTSLTTPDVKDISKEWPKPWLFFRIFIYLMIASVLLAFIVFNMGNYLAVPGLMFVSSMIGPAAVAVFFFETNSPRNISIFYVIKVFVIGGLMSLIVTLVIGNYVYQSFSLIGAFGIGLVEELGKAIVSALFINQINADDKKYYILNGLLIGSAVGAGFAVFETAGYVFATFLESMQIDMGWFSYSFDFEQSMVNMMAIIILRGITSIGTHAVWTAISGAALCVASNKETIAIKNFTSVPFLGAFIVPITLHALWDWEFGGVMKLLILSILPWFVAFIYINRGIKEINTEMNQATEQTAL